MKKQPRHILSLSGGKDSTALALYMRGKVPELEYVFCDTRKELPETYTYLDQIEAFLGQKIIRIESTRGFDHWLDRFQGFLPSTQIRWCTTYLKVKPFEDYIGDDPVINYVGLRADENRDARISSKPNIQVVYPFKEDGINYNGVERILRESGIGMPPYTQWGRTRSGCYFCFFQRPIEWVRLLETHPALFALAEEYEVNSNTKGGTFHWTDSMSLTAMRDPENIRKIKERYELSERRRLERRPNKTLMETMTGLNPDGDNEPRGCTICHL